ncbi:hypothetical protein Tco_0617431 [Tanacetum coccineum]
MLTVWSKQPHVDRVVKTAYVDLCETSDTKPKVELVDIAESNPEGAEWPTQVDIPENDEWEETPEQPEIDEHENAHILAAMAKEIKEMISQEVAKAQEAVLPHLKEYFGNIISQTIQEELIANLVGRVKEVTYNDFLACDPPSYSRESNPFLCHRWIQDVEGTCGAPSGAPSLARFQRLQRPLSRVYQMMKTEEAKEAPDVVTCTFFVNLLPARVLFDSGADRSFVSELFSQNFIVPISQLKPPLDVQIANSKIIHVANVFQNCKVEIDNEKFSIDQIPVPMGEIDVVVEELLGIPPDRQVEFRIDLIQGSTPVAKTPYRLAPSKMQELMKQLQELLDKGFICPSSSPWGAPVLFVKKKDGSMQMARVSFRK